MSRNAVFKRLDEKHEFCREWQQQLQAEEKTSLRVCNSSHTNQCPAASTWQIQCKDRSSSAVSKGSNTLPSQITRLPIVNSFAALRAK